jgi:hypothetical protein
LWTHRNYLSTGNAPDFMKILRHLVICITDSPLPKVVF